MQEKRIAERYITDFVAHLREEERAESTIEKYRREVQGFARWQGSRPVNKAVVTQWKEQLSTQGCQPATVNAKLVALNRFFAFVGWKECRVRYLKVQRLGLIC